MALYMYTLLLLACLGTVAAGPGCFECRDIGSPIDCGTSTVCSDTQQCYLEQIISSGGLILYNQGCQSKQRCSSSGRRSIMSKRQSSDIVVCSECCQGEFCNEQGCGITAPVPPQRGPLCYACANMLYPSECRQVITCEPGQLCVLFEAMHLGRSVYNSRCESNKVCDAIALIGRRRQTSSGTRCHKCCTKDFCNDDCNSSTTSLTNTPSTSPLQTSHTSSAVSATSTQSTPTLPVTFTSTSTTASTLTTPTSTAASTSTSITTTLQSTSQHSLTTNKVSCQANGYSHVLFLHLCFKFHYQYSSWTSARDICAKEGALLAVINTKPKWDFFKAILSQQHSSTSRTIWLGGKSVNANGSKPFFWTNGNIVAFNDWGHGQPNRIHYEACISSKANDNYHWHDLACSHQNHFICTMDV